MSIPEHAYINASGVGVIRQGRAILRDITLRVGASDFITVVGPNGAGKTMLLKALMGLEKIDSGTITHKENLRIGYVPQRLHADAAIPVTVRRFLQLRQRLREVDIQETAQECGIEAHLGCQLHVLSGGEMQRVLLARALLRKPDLLVLDEPAQNLDIGGQLAFYKLLEHVYARRGLSVLMVSHDLHLVMASTKKVVCLFHHICCSGEPQAVAKDPEFIALFGNDMARLMSVYHHEHHHHHEGEGHDHGHRPV